MSTFASAESLTAPSQPSRSSAGSASANPSRWARAIASATVPPASSVPSTTFVVEFRIPSTRVTVTPRRPWRARLKTGTPSITVVS